VADTQAPVVQPLPPATIACNASREPADIGMPNATDSCSPDALSKTFVDVAGNAEGNCPQGGNFTRVWTITGTRSFWPYASIGEMLTFSSFPAQTHAAMRTCPIGCTAIQRTHVTAQCRGEPERYRDSRCAAVRGQLHAAAGPELQRNVRLRSRKRARFRL
jgi:hypothetical protein